MRLKDSRVDTQPVPGGTQADWSGLNKYWELVFCSNQVKNEVWNEMKSYKIPLSPVNGLELVVYVRESENNSAVPTFIYVRVLKEPTVPSM